MGVFEDLHRDRVTGSLAMFDRMIFKGRLTALYKQNGAKCFLWSQGVALKDFTPYAKWTTARIADTVRGLAEAAGRPVISFDHVKTRNYAQRKDDLAKSIAERDGITEGISGWRLHGAYQTAIGRLWECWDLWEVPGPSGVQSGLAAALRTRRCGSGLPCSSSASRRRSCDNW
jgi:hypothetical protein